MSDDNRSVIGFEVPEHMLQANASSMRNSVRFNFEHKYTGEDLDATDVIYFLGVTIKEHTKKNVCSSLSHIEGIFCTLSSKRRI